MARVGQEQIKERTAVNIETYVQQLYPAIQEALTLDGKLYAIPVSFYTYAVLGDKSDIDMDYLRTLGPVTEVSQEQIFGY